MRNGHQNGFGPPSAPLSCQLADRQRPAKVEVSKATLAKLPPYRGKQSSKLESARAFASRLAARRRCIPEGRPGFRRIGFGSAVAKSAASCALSWLALLWK